MEDIRHLTNFTNNKAWRFGQASPLAVPLYSSGTQFVQSALFCVHPKGAVAFCYSPLFNNSLSAIQNKPEDEHKPDKPTVPLFLCGCVHNSGKSMFVLMFF